MSVCWGWNVRKLPVYPMKGAVTCVTWETSQFETLLSGVCDYLLASGFSCFVTRSHLALCYIYRHSVKSAVQGRVTCQLLLLFQSGGSELRRAEAWQLQKQFNYKAHYTQTLSLFSFFCLWNSCSHLINSVDWIDSVTRHAVMIQWVDNSIKTQLKASN